MAERPTSGVRKSVSLAGLVACLAAPFAIAPEARAADLMTLRLRDVPLVEVLFTLHALTGQSYVVDADVVGRVDVEMMETTPADVESALVGLGLSFSPPGRVRRVTAGAEPPTLRLPGQGDAIPILWRWPADVRDVLVFMTDVTGDEIVAPKGSLGRAAFFGSDLPTEDLLHAVLASARLESQRTGGRVRVWRRAEPRAPLFPANASDRNYGHAPYRAGEGVAPRHAGISGLRTREITLTGVFSNGKRWQALAEGGGYPRGPIAAEQPFLDGRVESVGPDGVVVLLASGGRVDWRVKDADRGVTRRPDRAEDVVDRARVQSDAGGFDEAAEILRTALDGAAAGDATRLRAALADTHYAWAQSRLVAHRPADAMRQLEAAYEIDRLDRPWQAGEDLNEIGFAWTELGEPERAVAPHQQALELARAKDFVHTPSTASCGRSHPRSAAIVPSALDGLANADRVRGRLGPARGFYEQAVKAWRAIGDPFGESAALTGLGLVHQVLGDPRRALALHQEALRKPLEDHPTARAAVLNNLGSAQVALGAVAAARESFGKALADYRRLGDRGGESAVLHNLGALAESRSEWTEACEAYVEALSAARDADNHRAQALTRERIERLLAGHEPTDESFRRCRAAGT